MAAVALSEGQRGPRDWQILVSYPIRTLSHEPNLKLLYCKNGRRMNFFQGGQQC